MFSSSSVTRVTNMHCTVLELLDGEMCACGVAGLATWVTPVATVLTVMVSVPVVELTAEETAVVSVVTVAVPAVPIAVDAVTPAGTFHAMMAYWTSMLGVVTVWMSNRFAAVAHSVALYEASNVVVSLIVVCTPAVSVITIEHGYTVTWDAPVALVTKVVNADVTASTMALDVLELLSAAIKFITAV